MTRRERWRRVLDGEIARLESMPAAELIAALPALEHYEVGFEGAMCQVEVQLLEDTPDYLHVGISVDDGSLPQSLAPAAGSFIVRRDPGRPGPDRVRRPRTST